MSQKPTVPHGYLRADLMTEERDGIAFLAAKDLVSAGKLRARWSKSFGLCILAADVSAHVAARARQMSALRNGEFHEGRRVFSASFGAHDMVPLGSVRAARLLAKP